MAAIRTAAVVMAAAVIATASVACSGKAGRPQGREADPTRDRECRDPARPKAYFYPAEDRTRYAPDDPFRDGCESLVPDHLFCCPPPVKSAEAKP